VEKRRVFRQFVGFGLGDRRALAIERSFEDNNFPILKIKSEA
jgi:hypothetical protein